MNLYLKIIFLLLLSFITFAFAGTVPWAFTTFLTGSLILFTILITYSGFVPTKPFKIAIIGFLILITYTFIQGLSYTNILLPAPCFPASIMPLYTFEHISVFLSWFAVFVIAANIPHKFKDTKHLLMLILIVTSFTAGLHGVLRGDYLALFTNIRGGVGPFVNRNNGGIFLFLGSMVSLIILLVGFSKKNTYLEQNKMQQFYWKQIAFTVLTLIMFIATIFSRSRGAMLALFNGLFFYSIFLSSFFPRTAFKKATFSLLTLITFIFIGFSSYIYQEEINIFAQRNTTISMDIRKDMNAGALKAIKQRPYFGYGVGTVPIMITNYTDIKTPRYIQQLHNDPLELLLGIGFIPFIPLLLLIFLFFFCVLRNIKKQNSEKKIVVLGLIAALISFMISSVFDFHLAIPACSSIFFAMAGILCNQTFYPQTPTRIHLNYISISIMVTLFLVSLYIPFQKTLAWREMSLGQGLKFEEKTIAYQNAIKFYPSPRYALRLALAYYNQSLNKNIAPSEREKLRKQAHSLAETYLKKYPREKELSKVYLLTL